MATHSTKISNHMKCVILYQNSSRKAELYFYLLEIYKIDEIYLNHVIQTILYSNKDVLNKQMIFT